MRKTFLLCLILVSPFSHAVEVLRWQRLPLPVALPLGQERIVFVDRNVRVGTPASLQGKLRVQSVAGAVYLKALEPIDPTRIQLQDKESGEIILLDIATSTELQEPEPIKIVAAQVQKQTTDDEAADKPPVLPSKTPVPAALTRYAAQMMYAPLRTVEPLPGVRQIPLRIKGNLSSLLPTLPTQNSALGAWSVAPWIVTAVRVSNAGNERLVLDPRSLQGDFYAATFQHPDLGPKGTAEDTTTLYLVTRDKGLESALVSAPQEGSDEK